MSEWPIHARIDGPIVMIGFGSIGRGTLPLLLRHVDFDRSRLVVIDPDDSHRALLDEHGVRFVHEGGEYHPGGGPGHERCELAYQALGAAVEAALGR